MTRRLDHARIRKSGVIYEPAEVKKEKGWNANQAAKPASPVRHLSQDEIAAIAEQMGLSRSAKT